MFVEAELTEPVDRPQAFLWAWTAALVATWPPDGEHANTLASLKGNRSLSEVMIEEGGLDKNQINIDSAYIQDPY